MANFDPATDPSLSQFSSSQQTEIGKYINKTGLPDTTGSQGSPGTGQFIEDELDAAKARGTGDPFAGFGLPKNVSTTDFFALVGAAESFAANAGWQYYPTPVDIQWWLQNGQPLYGSGNTQQFNSWLAYRAGIQTTMPWAAQGMKKADWDLASARLDSTLQEMTGQSSWDQAGFGKAMKAQAIKEGWTQSELQAKLTAEATNPNGSAYFNSNFGWVQQGMSYQQFQTYKQTNQQKLQSRYGTSFTDAQAIADMKAGLQQFTATGTAVDQSQSKQAQAPTTTAPGQSSIR